MTRHRTAFTIVELLIVVAVIAILVVISVVAYNGIQKTAADKSVQSDLQSTTGIMQRAALQAGGAYPTTLPAEIKSSPNVTLTLKRSGTTNFYSPVNDVQNGVLFAQICQDLIDEGVGKGVNQGGITRDYLTGCGNWNNNSMQITGWDSQVYATPLAVSALATYADNFTTNDAFNKIHETVVKNFYSQLIERLPRQGGSFPVTSFWDSWATTRNGGVMIQPLGTPQLQPSYCIEGTHASYSTIKWRVTETLRLIQAGC